ncbi:MAG: hypothetical protein IPN92_08305 [Chromatiaceae bacterium]|nr:hypothetical protein [Chromatiaceae bacterium]
MIAPASTLRRAVLATALLLVAPAWGDGVGLYDKAELETAFKQSAPCCVVDARSEATRGARPLADAVIYRLGVRIAPTAAVVVIGDNDVQAMAAGKALAATSGAKDVYAVKGGLATWQALMPPAPEAAEGVMPSTFIIPKNTCEHGPPLQELRFDRQ